MTMIVTDKKPYQICKRCVMDTSAEEITFDENGICNFCTEFETLAAETIWRPLDIRLKELESAVEKIKQIGHDDKG